MKMQELYEANALEPTKKEQMIINPKVGYEVTNEMLNKSIPHNKLHLVKEKYGSISRFSYAYTPVDNLLWDYIHFVNIDYFRPAAIAFELSVKSVAGTKIAPAYNRYIVNTPAWKAYWKEEANRCINGYEPIVDGKPCGIRIPGEFYFYLNYSWIRKVKFDEITGEPISDESGFPDFLAMDYYYYRELESRENPSQYGLPLSHKQSMVVTKARRLGFSFKASAGAVWKIAFNNKNKVLIASVEGKDAATCFKKSIDIIDHLTNFTPFGLEDIGLPSQNGGWKHVPRSVKKDSGYFSFTAVNTKSGERMFRQSSIETVSLYNKADAIAGEGLSRLYFEEAGKISNLAAAWEFSAPALKVGTFYRNGIAIMFGTGGKMVANNGNDGSSKAFSNFFYSPKGAGLAEYGNIYDYNMTDRTCGYFVPIMWFYKAEPVVIDNVTYRTLDNQGNAYFWVAELALNRERIASLPPKKSKKEYETFLTQYCKTPSEAFLVSEGSRFQTEDLHARKRDIEMSIGGFNTLRVCGELIDTSGIIEFIPKPELEPIVSSDISVNDREGCLVRYEPPLYIKGQIPEDAYIISVDPIGINTASGNSLVAIIVFKTGIYPELGEEKIVATYYGRKKINPQDYMHRLLLKLSKYYNAQITVENDRDGGIPQFFIKHNQAHRLMGPPRFTMNKSIIQSKTNLREFGHSMASAKHKTLGETLIYEWLDKTENKRVHTDTETGEQVFIEGVRNVDRLNDQMLIEQLIRYSRDGNFDAVSAFMGIMVQMKEKFDPDKERDDEYNFANDLYEYYNKRFN